MSGFRPRLIPVLLLQNGGLVKTRKFAQPSYIGDAINAVRIFNDLRADELTFLDISASQKGCPPSLDFVREVAAEAHMPFAVGGGIRSLPQIQQLLQAGAEKVVLGSIAVERPEFVGQAAREFGCSTIAVCMDIKKTFWKPPTVWHLNARNNSGQSPLDFARRMQDLGAGELIVQSVERDGSMQGYDLALLRQVADALSIPIVALGGAANLEDLRRGYAEGGAQGLAAGSLFVFHGTMRGVLLNYPTRAQIHRLFSP